MEFEFSSVGDIDKFIDRLEKVAEVLVEETRTPIVEEMVDNAVLHAQSGFNRGENFGLAYGFDGGLEFDQPTVVSKKSTSDGFEVVANGEDALYIEFGSGVRYNSGSSYPQPLPDGVDAIGTHISDNNTSGYPHGNKDTWFFNKDGEKFYSHGNPAFMPMYHAQEEIKNNIINRFFK